TGHAADVCEGGSPVRRLPLTTLALSAAVLAIVLNRLAPAADPASGPDPNEVRAVVAKAVAYLKTRQGTDGSFAPRLAGPGVTAVAAAALLRNGYGPDDPVVAPALAYLEKKVQPDGGVYERMLANYTTSVAVMAFAEANKGGRYDAVLKNATQFLRTLQS